jgi:hypothetical protein
MTRARRLLLLALLAACTDAPARASLRVTSFQRAADRVAARTGTHVAAWGEAMLADDGLPRRFAVLEPDEGSGRGGYLIEDRPGRAWLVTVEVDGRTLLWGLDGEDSWQLRDDGAVDHEQGHRHGAERIVFALRGRRLVVLEHDYLDDVDRDVVERRRFAIDGTCEEPCPPLDGFATEDLWLEVEGPGPARGLGVPPPSDPPPSS